MFSSGWSHIKGIPGLLFRKPYITRKGEMDYQVILYLSQCCFSEKFCIPGLKSILRNISRGLSLVCPATISLIPLRNWSDDSVFKERILCRVTTWPCQGRNRNVSLCPRRKISYQKKTTITGLSLDYQLPNNDTEASYYEILTLA